MKCCKTELRIRIVTLNEKYHICAVCGLKHYTEKNKRKKNRYRKARNVIPESFYQADRTGGIL